MNLGELRHEMSRLAPAWQPRGMAVICFAAAAMLVYTAIFPVDSSETEVGQRAVIVAVTFAAGVVYWTLASRFRIWMVHLVVTGGFLWGTMGLSMAESSLGAALNLTTLLWTCVFVGAAFRPTITRAYAVLVCLGIVVGMTTNGVPGEVPLGLAFAGSFVVTMEILSRATSQLRHEATTDSLTGLLNRTGLEREVHRVRSFGRDDRIAVLVADLDGFKSVNDRHGHLTGDRALKEFAKAWREGARTGDLVARLGGDEFVVVFPAVGDDAEAIVERLRRVAPMPWSGGLAIAEPGESLESCISRADRLLYEEKARKALREDAGFHPDPILIDDPGAASAE